MTKNLFLILILSTCIFACNDETESEETNINDGGNENVAGEAAAGEAAAGEAAAAEAAAGEATAGETDEMMLEIIGSYTDNFMTEHVITDETWTQTYGEDAPSIFNIEIFNNEAQYLIAQNDEGNMYSPSLWSRIDWTINGDELWFCQGVFDAESAENAESAAAADATDPANSGCGTFAWSLLTAQ